MTAQKEEEIRNAWIRDTVIPLLEELRAARAEIARLNHLVNQLPQTSVKEADVNAFKLGDYREGGE